VYTLLSCSGNRSQSIHCVCCKYLLLRTPPTFLNRCLFASLVQRGQRLSSRCLPFAMTARDSVVLCAHDAARCHNRIIERVKKATETTNELGLNYNIHVRAHGIPYRTVSTRVRDITSCRARTPEK